MRVELEEIGRCEIMLLQLHVYGGSWDSNAVAFQWGIGGYPAKGIASVEENLPFLGSSRRQDVLGIRMLFAEAL
jgi:hypothetical protein